MDELSGPVCSVSEAFCLADHHECQTCGHEWPLVELAEEIPGARIARDAYGNELANGEVVAMIKDLKLKGSSTVLEVGTKSKPIRLVDGDHEISCKMEGLAIGIKACFVKKVMSL